MAIEQKFERLEIFRYCFTKEVLQTLKVEEGASLYITESPKCGIQVNAEKPHFKEKMQVAEDAMRRYRNTFRKLAE